MLLISAAEGVWMVTAAQVVLSSEVELEPGVKVECVSKLTVWPSIALHKK